MEREPLRKPKKSKSYGRLTKPWHMMQDIHHEIPRQKKKNQSTMTKGV
jgi:hypothetical protein